MEKKLILGVSASPRKDANTDRMLRYALEAAETVEGIETEIIYLRDYDIHNCKGCFACCREPGKRDGGIHACAVYQDGMEEILIRYSFSTYSATDLCMAQSSAGR